MGLLATQIIVDCFFGPLSGRMGLNYLEVEILGFRADGLLWAGMRPLLAEIQSFRDCGTKIF